MGPASSRLLLATCAVLVAVLVGTIWNAVSLRRLRADMEDQSRHLAALGTDMSAVEGVVARAAGGKGPGAAVPGLPSMVDAIGWDGRRAPVLHVEGAVEDAPLRPADKPRPQGDWLVARRASPPSTLNPLVGSEGEAAVLTAPVIGRLLALDPDAPPAVAASLATSWEMSPDGLQCTYRLRRGVQFADGRPFTSADVLFSLAALRDPDIPAQALRGLLADVVAVSAPDAFTVVASFRERDWRAPLLLGNALRILNKGWYEEELAAWARRAGLPEISLVPGQPGFAAAFSSIRIPCPGTGPYYFAGSDLPAGRAVELVRNPFSWAMQVWPERHSFDGLRWVAIADDRAALEAMRRGEIDSLVIDLAEWDDVLAKDAALAAVATRHEYDHAGLGSIALAWNCRKPPFDDPRVRRALTQALDREAILAEAAGGRGVVPSGPAKPSDPQSAPDIAPWPHDVAAARQLLADAGWADTNADGHIDGAGAAFDVTLKVGSARPLHAEIARRVASAAAAVGVRVTVSSVDWTTFRRNLDERTFDIALVEAARATPWYDPRDDFHSSQDTEGGGNITGWQHAEADALLDTMRGELDEAKRREAAHRFHSIFHEEQPWTMILEPRVGVLIHSRIEGVTLRPTGIQTFDMFVAPERVLRR